MKRNKLKELLNPDKCNFNCKYQHKGICTLPNDEEITAKDCEKIMTIARIINLLG